MTKEQGPEPSDQVLAELRTSNDLLREVLAVLREMQDDLHGLARSV